MNDFSIVDLTLKLQKALDSNYDVIDMATVLFVISQLEGATITKEQLETTRLGKYINQLRRRTWSEQLARRSKNLLKKWREMVIPSLASQNSQQSNLQNLSQQIQQINFKQQQQQSCPALYLQTPTSPSQIFSQKQNQLTTVNDCSSSYGGSTINNSTSANKFHMSISNGEIIHNNDQLNYESGPLNLVRSSTTNLPKMGNNKSINKSAKKPPISFANLLTTSQSQVSTNFSNQTNVGPSFLLEEDSQSPILPLQTIKKLSKVRKSPLPSCMEHSVSPLEFEHTSNSQEDSIAIRESTTDYFNSTVSQVDNNKRGRLVNGRERLTVFDINDSDSNSKCDVDTSMPSLNLPNVAHNKELTMTTQHLKKMSNTLPENFSSSTDHRKNKKHKKDKVRRSKQIDRLLENLNPNVFPEISMNPMSVEVDQTAFQTQDSLSNSSISIFPNVSDTTTTTVNPSRVISGFGTNNDTPDYDLTFSGRFRTLSGISQTNDSVSTVKNTQGCSSTITRSSTDENKANSNKLKTQAHNNSNSIVIIESRSCSPFASTAAVTGNSNDSLTSSNHTLNQDLSNVISQDSHGIIEIPDDISPPEKNPQLSARSNENIAHQINNNVIDDAKVPKKRGRKKGSKGADGMLAQSNTVFFSSQLFENSRLLSMPTFTAGSKKVKTTKELLADIQNRKIGSATSSPTLLTSQTRPLSPSTSSDTSQQSQSNSDVCSISATPVSTSTVNRPSPDRTTSNIIRGLGKRTFIGGFSQQVEPIPKRARIPMQYLESITTDVDEYNSVSDSNEASINTSFPQIFDDETKPKFEESNKSSSKILINKEIKKLLDQLPPINRDFCLDDNFDVICTCIVKEVVDSKPKILDNNENNSEIEKKGNITLIENNDEKENTNNLNEDKFDIDSLSNESNMNEIIESKNFLPIKLNPKPVKSIFDLDYDEDDDPLKTCLEECKTSIPKESKDHVLCQDQNKNKLAVQQNKNLIIESSGAQSNEWNLFDSKEYQEIVFPKYEVVEDPNCLAKHRYQIQNNMITNYHVESLHNYCIPNVNGNWNDLNIENINDVKTLKKFDLQSNSDGLYERVVPQYNHIVMDRIPKDLSHIKFNRNSKISKKYGEETTIKNLINIETNLAEHDLEKCIDEASDIDKFRISKNETIENITKASNNSEESDNNAPNNKEVLNEMDFEMEDQSKIEVSNSPNDSLKNDSINTSNNSIDHCDSENEEYDKDYNDGSTHEIVQNNITSSTQNQKHIVITIKKTLNKHRTSKSPKKDKLNLEENKIDDIINKNENISENFPAIVASLDDKINIVEEGITDIKENNTNIEIKDESKEAQNQYEESLPENNNFLLESFNNLTAENYTGVRITSEDTAQEFREWHELLHLRSFNDELLTILPYVVID